MLDGLAEERLRARRVAVHTQEDIDDHAVFVDRSVDGPTSAPIRNVPRELNMNRTPAGEPDGNHCAPTTELVKVQHVRLL